MRWLLFLLILVVAAVIVALATGFLDISQNRAARAPDLNVSESGISAKGGEMPTFDVETGTVAVGTRSTNVNIPSVNVNPPSNSNRQQSEDQPAGSNRTADGA